MRYIFDTNNNEDGFSISVKIGENNYYGNNNDIVVNKSEFKTMDLEKVLQTILNNVRLTVDERKNAENDLKEFVEYVRYTPKS